jgi:hypothetical protein
MHNIKTIPFQYNIIKLNTGHLTGDQFKARWALKARGKNGGKYKYGDPN